MDNTPNDFITKNIVSILKNKSLSHQIEILANVLIIIGANHIDLTKKNLTPENIAEIILNDRQKNGETIANALALQGLTMLLWLKK